MPSRIGRGLPGAAATQATARLLPPPSNLASWSDLTDGARMPASVSGVAMSRSWRCGHEQAYRRGDLARYNLISTSKGAPKPLLANAITALQEAPAWFNVLAFDEFRYETVINEAPPWDKC